MVKEPSDSVGEAQFDVVGDLIVSSERLRADDGGRIVEDPGLLAKFAECKAALAQLADSALLIDEICVVEGAYVARVMVAPDLIDPTSVIDLMVTRLTEDKKRLEANRDELNPVSAAACGVSSSSLKVLQVTSDLYTKGHTVALELFDRQRKVLPAPDPRDLAALVPDSSQKPRKIDGEINGIGRGDDQGSWITLARGQRILVPDLTLERAWGHLSEGTHVIGVAEFVEGELVLSDPEFSLVQQSLLT